MTKQEIQSKIQSAIDVLIKREAILLQNDIAERTITARLACYIQEEFPDLNVDCEYNRNLNDIKRLKKICNPSNHENGSSVYPDIIIHKRMTKENFVVIEVKKTTNNTTDECDMQKLEAFRRELGYQHGLFIRLIAGVEDIGIESMIWV